MKRYLLPKKNNSYKANLHCHTTLSDGKFTPEEIKEAYMKNGYSVVAYTDHNIFITHPELSSEDFLALNGFEIDVNDVYPDGDMLKWMETKTCHICYIATDPENDIHPLWHRSKYLFSNAVNYRDEVKFDESKPDYERVYSAEAISEMMKIGRENGFFVTYNHPRWSLETYDEYGKYENMHAMEIYNHGCFTEGYFDYNPVVYDEMLRSGKQLYCISADDNHSERDMCGGYVRICAEELSYKAIAQALLNGEFYSSRGPEIKGLWYDDEDGAIHLLCSPAVKIICSTGIRRMYVRTANGSDGLLTEAVFPIKGNEKYVRFSIFDSEGKTADTNAYFVDALSL